MEPVTTAALIGAGASILGGLTGASAQRKANAENIRYQTLFAQEGIRWKVNDAVQAGIHPLYALGASTHSFAPTVVGADPYSGLAQAGQDISRAVDATRTREEREALAQHERWLAQGRREEAEAAARAAQSERERENARRDAKLMSDLATDEAQRQLFYSQARKLDQERGPAFPSVGTGSGSEKVLPAAGSPKIVPSEITQRDVVDSSRVAGAEPAFLMVEVTPGKFIRVPNPKINLDSEIIHAGVGGSMYGNAWLNDLTNWWYEGKGSRADFRRRELEAQKSQGNRWADPWRSPRRGVMPRRDPYHGLW